MRLLVSVSLALLLCAPSYLPQQTATGVIEGIVVNATTGEPVGGAQVTLTPINLLPGTPVAPAAGIAVALSAPPPPAAPNAGPVANSSGVVPVRPPQTSTVTTGSDGKFSFKQLNASTYRVMAAANGYVRQEYGQRALNGPGRPIYLSSGEAFKEASIRLTPTGTLSGRILDESGQPAIGVPVGLFRTVYNPQGRKAYQSAGTGTVDDRGQYRIFGVTPGRYYLNAGNPPGPLRSLVPGGGAPGSTRYESIYYPGVKDIEQASPIEINSRSEVSMDMRVTRQPQTFRVRGKVIDSATGTPPVGVSISLAFRSSTSGGGSFSQGRTYDPATGSFELQNISPGDYVVQAQVQGQLTPLAGPVDAATLEARRIAQASWPSAQVPIRVSDSDIDGIALTLKVPATVAGRVTLEGRPISAVTNLDRLRFNLIPDNSAAGPAGGVAPVALSPGADGTFEIRGLREGDYRFMVLTPSSDLYVKSIQYGGDDIFTKPFRFSGVASGTVDVVLRTGTASLSGTVTNAQSQAVPGIMAELVSVQPERPDAYRTAMTDQTGRFSMAGIPPGDYRIFSWEAADNGAFYDPEFLKQYEQRGQPMHLAESANQTVDVKMIPAP